LRLIGPEELWLIGSILEQEFRNLPISDCFRSSSSMIVLKFGALRQVSTSFSHAAERRHGDWDIIIELADWTLSRSGGRIASCESRYPEIDSVLEGLMGEIVRDLYLSEHFDLKIIFSSGLQLEIVPSSTKGRLSQWVIFRRELWSVELRTRDDLAFSAASSFRAGER